MYKNPVYLRCHRDSLWLAVANTVSRAPLGYACTQEVAEAYAELHLRQQAEWFDFSNSTYLECDSRLAYHPASCNERCNYTTKGFI